MAHQTLRIIKDIDLNLSYWLYKGYPKTSFCDRILKTLEWSCHGVPWLIINIICIFIWPRDKFLTTLLSGLLIDIIFVAILKALIIRQRPNYAIQNDQFGVILVDKHSFPSGHASRSVYLAMLFGTSITKVWSFLVVVSRIFLGRHYISDALAGALLGYFVYNVQFSFNQIVNNVMVWCINKILRV